MRTLPVQRPRQSVRELLARGHELLVLRFCKRFGGGNFLQLPLQLEALDRELLCFLLRILQLRLDLFLFVHRVPVLIRNGFALRLRRGKVGLCRLKPLLRVL